MIVGVPKEIKNNEFRVSTTPSGVHALVSAGHEVLVEVGAGLGSAILDSEYVSAGAKIVTSADEVWQKSELIIKVKEPIAAEYASHACWPNSIYLSTPRRISRMYRCANKERHDCDRLRNRRGKSAIATTRSHE